MSDDNQQRQDAPTPSGRQQIVQVLLQPGRNPEGTVQNVEGLVDYPGRDFLAPQLARLVGKEDAVQSVRADYWEYFRPQRDQFNPNGATPEDQARIGATLPIIGNNSSVAPGYTFIQFRAPHFNEQDVQNVLTRIQPLLGGEDVVRMARGSDFASGQIPAGDSALIIRDSALPTLGGRLAILRGEDMIRQHPELLSYLDTDLVRSLRTPESRARAEQQIRQNLGAHTVSLNFEAGVPYLLITDDRGMKYTLVGSDGRDDRTPDIGRITQQIGDLTPGYTPGQTPSAGQQPVRQ